jgi:uncharacterized protein YgiM (DUF1202 family)
MGVKRQIFLCSLLGLLVAFLAAYAVADVFPCKGVLTGDRVRIRVGPSMSHAEILKLNKGNEVRVYAREGKWLKIAVPESATLWIHKKYVKEATGETGKGVVTGTRVNIRLKEKGTVVGQANKGQEITVVGRKGVGILIRPIENTYAYIHADFVELEGAEEAPPDSEFVLPLPPGDPSDPAVEKTETADKEPADINLDALPERLGEDLENKLMDLKEKASLAFRAEDFEMVTKYMAEVKELRRIIESESYVDQKKLDKLYQERLKRIKEIIRDMETRFKELEVKKRQYVAEGWLYEVAPHLISPPPGPFKLKNGKCVLYYLKSSSSDVRLEDLLYKRVGIMGEVMPDKKGWGAELILVRKIYNLDHEDNE